MRDIFVTVVVFGLLPFCLTRPSIGVLVFSWLSYMNPHRLTWGFAYDFQFAKVVAVATMIGMVFSKETKRFPVNATVIVWIALIGWMSFTTFFAFLPDDAWEGLVKTTKIQIMAFVTLYVMGTKDRMIALVWVIVLSFAFFGVKGGIFAIATGGESRIWGPTGSFIEDNNSLGLALIMTIPLMRFLQLQARQNYLKWILVAAMILTGVCVLATQSRGALLGLIAMGAMFWLKSHRKVIIGIILVSLIPFAIMKMPDSWHERMRTIQTYEEDGSAMTRLRVWRYSFDIANRRIVGTGFRGIAHEYGYKRYLPEMYQAAIRTDNPFPNAHSIWFGMLGQHGWIGLILFITLGVLAWRNGSWVIRNTRDRADLHWCRDLAAMIQVSLLGYAATGTFLSMEYYDLYYHVIAILVLLQVYVRDRLGEPLEVRNPALSAAVPA